MKQLLKITTHSISYLLLLVLQETEPDFDEDIKEDVCEECNKHGRVIHVWVDKNSAVYAIGVVGL